MYRGDSSQHGKRTLFPSNGAQFLSMSPSHVAFSASASGGKDLVHWSKMQHHVVHAFILSTLHICGGESGYREIFSWPLHPSRTLYFHECAYHSGSMSSNKLAGWEGAWANLLFGNVLKWSMKAVLQQYVMSARRGFLMVEKKTVPNVLFQ